MSNQNGLQANDNLEVMDERKVRTEFLKTLLDHETRLGTYAERLDKVEKKVDEQIIINSGEQRVLQKAVARRVYEFNSTPEERRKLFKQIHREIKDRWAVPSYKDIRRNELQEVLNYVNAWRPIKVVA